MSVAATARALRVPDDGTIALPEGDRAWRVAEGRVEVYLLSTERRRLVAIVEPGGYLFPLPAGEDLSLGLVAPTGATIAEEAAPDAEALAQSAAAWVRRAARPLGLAVPRRDDGAVVPWVQRFTLALDAHHAAAERRRDAEDAARIAARAGAADAGADSGLRRALADAAAALGIAGAAGAAPPAADDADFAAVPQLARAARLRARRVVLPPGWWREDMGPLIVRRDATAIVTLRWRARGYVDPAGETIDAEQAQRCDATAYVAHAPLPRGVAGFAGLARHVLAGTTRDLGQIALGGAAVAVVGLSVPFATSWIFADIVPAGAGGLLVAAGLALVAAALVQALIGAAQALGQARIEGRSAIRLAAGLSDRLLTLPAGFFKTVAAGDLNQRIQSVEAIRQLIVGILLASGLSALFSLVYLALLFVADARLGAFAAGLALVYAAALAVSRLLQIGALREAAVIDGRIAGVAYETIDGIAKLRTAAAEPRAMARWRALYLREQEVALGAGRVQNRFAAFADAWPIVTLAGLFAAAALLSREALAPGRFLGFLSAYAIFQTSFVAFCEALLKLVAAQPLAERAAPLLAAQPEGQDGRADPGRLSGQIEMSGVSFGYGEGPPLLAGLSFALRPGEHLAIVGGSGSGKSTVLRLLLGFERPRTGAVLYDGQDLAGLDPGRVRTQIGAVMQTSRLFAGSVLENIRGASDLSLEQCLAAAERAGLAPDLATMPMGIHTAITEGGGTFSGGQRQRILIARALAAEPRILFLDEATSALDNVTQAVVAETIDRLKVARVTIAHRLSTVRHADRICVLAGGRFVETGRYDELIAQRGAFAALAERQLMKD